ncbi:MAG TPA: DUF6027 family protein [Solirubrobacteraceae bacterium]|jgi:hypothetical protein|nr:DUF6027 family protein [Solirubrobacteraceae bacterium]
MTSRVPKRHQAFAAVVADSRLQDPSRTLANLSDATGVPVDDLVHHALVRWASAGSEAVMALEPLVLRDLIAARKHEDWRAVGGIVDWLEATLDGQIHG